MAKLAILPYSRRSQSAKVLTEALNAANYVGPDTKHVVCWGSYPGAPREALNQPGNVSLAVNKIQTLRVISEGGAVSTVPWTTSKDLAKEWIEQGHTVMCRTLTNSSSGKGIVIAQTKLDLVDAPLYTKFIDKDAEYRIHVFDGQVIDQRKKVRATDGRAITSNHICTHSNGYVFNFADAPAVAKENAIAAVKALGLDFGAVDIITKARRGTMGIPLSYDAWVLEVNTAPGLTGHTITAYANAIKRKFNL